MDRVIHWDAFHEQGKKSRLAGAAENLSRQWLPASLHECMLLPTLTNALSIVLTHAFLSASGISSIPLSGIHASNRSNSSIPNGRQRVFHSLRSSKAYKWASRRMEKLPVVDLVFSSSFQRHSA